MDVEGLRRRRGREPSTPQPAVPLGVEDQARGEGADGKLGISLNMCLLGALVLLGLGLLLFSGESGTSPAGALSLHSGPSCPPPMLSPHSSTSSEGLTLFLCLHPQVASQSLRVVSGEGALACTRLSPPNPVGS